MKPALPPVHLIGFIEFCMTKSYNVLRGEFLLNVRIDKFTAPIDNSDVSSANHRKHKGFS